MRHVFISLALTLVLALAPLQTRAATGDTGVSVKAGAINFSQLNSRVLRYIDVTLTAAQMDTLNATPVTVLAAPGSGYANQVESIFCLTAPGATQFELGSGTLDFRYESSGGGLVGQITNACIEGQAACSFSDGGRAAVVWANTVVVAYASSDVTGGTGTVSCRVHYRTIRSTDI